MSEVKCNEIELLLDAFHDRELQAKDSQLVEQHLNSCLPCCQKLETIGQIVSRLQRLPKLNLDVDIAGKLDDLLPQPKVIAFRSRILWAGLAATAAVCLIFVGHDFNGSQPKLSTSLPEHKIAQPDNGHQIATVADKILPSTNQPKMVAIKVVADDPVKKLPVVSANRVEIATLLEEDRNTITEAIGLPSDEDGLYALKM